MPSRSPRRVSRPSYAQSTLDAASRASGQGSRTDLSCRPRSSRLEWRTRLGSQGISLATGCCEDHRQLRLGACEWRRPISVGVNGAAATGTADRRRPSHRSRLWCHLTGPRRQADALWTHGRSPVASVEDPCPATVQLDARTRGGRPVAAATQRRAGSASEAAGRLAASFGMERSPKPISRQLCRTRRARLVEKQAGVLDEHRIAGVRAARRVRSSGSSTPACISSPCDPASCCSPADCPSP